MSLQIRHLQLNDIDSAIELQKTVYRYVPPFTPEQFKKLLSYFPSGQFVAEVNGEFAGMAISLQIMWDDYSLHHTWESVTGNGEFDTHDQNGLTLYGAEVCVSPEHRGQGVGHALYEARKQLCCSMNLKRIIAGGRLPGYHNHATRMSPDEYAKRVIWGDLYDEVLRFQLREGFDYCGILHGYLPTDVESIGNAALIVWLNRDYDPKLPTLTAPTTFD